MRPNCCRRCAILRSPCARRGCRSPSMPRKRTSSICLFAVRAAAHRSGTRRLEWAWACGPGLWQAHASGARLAVAMAAATGRHIPVRLVKGAYWDSEIKRAQEAGLHGYPVFTRKVIDRRHLSRLRARTARAAAMSSSRNSPPTMPTPSRRSPVLAGTTAISSSSASMAWARRFIEQVVGRNALNQPCRIYAPVGSHEDLLAYLVRRLLENGANTSFVNRLADDEAPIADIIADPVSR